MESITPTNEFVEIEGRQYLNPRTGLDESTAFIENLRATQGQQNQEIFTDTQRLGTDISSDLGGLTGANSYFTSRYQTPQTNANVANLRATAQAAALNEVLANEQAIWKKRYQDAYRNYQKRQYDKTYGGGGPNGTNPTDTITGGVKEKATDKDTEVTYSGSVSGIGGYYTVIGPDGRAHLVDMETGEETVLAPENNTSNSGGSGMGYSGGGSNNARGSGFGGR